MHVCCHLVEPSDSPLASSKSDSRAECHGHCCNHRAATVGGSIHRGATTLQPDLGFWAVQWESNLCTQVLDRGSQMNSGVLLESATTLSTAWGVHALSNASPATKAKH